MAGYRVVKQNGVQMGQNCVLGVPMTQPPTEFFFNRDRRSILTRMQDRIKSLEARVAAEKAMVAGEVVKPAMVHTFGVVNQQQARADFLRGKKQGWFKV